MSLVILTLMMGMGLAMYSYVDGQAGASAQERLRESAFNQTEGVLDAQTYLLSRYWPGDATAAYPDCTYSNGTTTVTPTGSDAGRCVDPAALATAYTGDDYEAGVTWKTQIRDNGGTGQCDGSSQQNCEYFYETARVAAQPRYDANRDNAIWIRAEATVRQKRRIVVSLVRIDTDPVVFPRSGLATGWFHAQGGPKPYVSQNGSALLLRCAPISSEDCFDTSKVGQVEGPGPIVGGYQPFADSSHTLPPSDLERLRARARNDGTYNPPGQCPSSFEGAVIFVENANCIINGNLRINEPPKPSGILVFASGTVRVNGTLDFWGVIWMYNGQGQSDPYVFDARGNSRINGSLFIDGRGGFEAGGNTRISYDANAVGTISGYGVTTRVKSSFRELKP
jgi:hypothetical protein